MIAKLRELSGNAQDWIVPNNAVSNSFCTDISLPSILTGCGAHETIKKLHRLPFIFDLAKSRNYETCFFTSSSLKWARFEAFFSAAWIAHFFKAESAKAAFINELTVDDMLPARALSDHIKHSDGKLLAVLCGNSIHVPYQSEKIVDIPDTLNSRRSLPLHLLESVHEEIFAALHKLIRYKDAMILVIGDHGDLDHSDGAAGVRSAALLTQLQDDVIYPRFMIKAPRHLPALLRQNLAANQTALIAYLEIVPTIAGLFGLTCTGDRYAGQNLFEPIADDRLALPAMSINGVLCRAASQRFSRERRN